MRIVLQRVSSAKVEENKKVVGSISNGLLILLGVGRGDAEAHADQLAEKIIKLRIFSDEDDKMNKSVQDIGGEILVVSQFTLYGDCKKGNRPGFTDAAPPEEGERLYEYFVEKLRELGMRVETGEFGAMMEVSLVNDGPVTLVLDTEK